ncbi:DUF2203 domain-containing protein [Microcoleus sp. FACHB-672]|uniref:DUF2203 domain-containing protein n=1 Tax=Microcoleus sp. FACHB-672 TaxID=2692825 RepID=UPI001685AE30|nr:DUF2203 domain-containing protein [Microcoleus sp. FACHB-672]MBD2041079.1 DUF2203 domain-containing protein [Microcoleus sp. FACHB-672]
MNSTPEPSSSDPAHSASNNPEEQDFEQALLETESYLQALKERYQQIQQDRSRQAELQQQQKQIKKEMRQDRSRQLQADLRRIQEELETIELNLESSLFTWGTLKEPFWQAVRFGGLGIVVGWILKSCTG